MTPSKYIYLPALLVVLFFGSNAQTNSKVNQELINERGMYSKVFLKENGEHQAVISPAPVHYKKNGIWEDINTIIYSTGNGYQNESNIIRSYFPNNIQSSGKIKLIINSDDEIVIHSEKKLVLLNNQGAPIVISASINNSIANVINNTIHYSDIYSGISDEFKILNGEIKNNVILSTLPSLLSNVTSGYFGFKETIELPDGWRIVASDSTVDVLTSSPLLILDSIGNTLLSIPAPVFFDSYGLNSDGSNPVEGKYLINCENDQWSITTLVPVLWLKDVNTNYPISIDPTVIIAGTTGGWQSPNNFVDNPGFVFIGVRTGI